MWRQDKFALEIPDEIVAVPTREPQGLVVDAGDDF
jgi:hypothetical protein